MFIAKRLSVAVAAAALLGLAACGSQKSDFIDLMTQNDAEDASEVVLGCAYDKLLESEGADFIDEFMDSVGDGLPKGAFAVAGAIVICTTELTEQA